MNRGTRMVLFAHDPQHAIAEFAAVEGKIPSINRPMYHDAYGMALMQLGRPQEAKVHFQRVLELTKGHAGFRNQGDMALNALKQLQEKTMSHSSPTGT